MEETILTWNVTNWITVLVMVAVGYLVLGFVAQIARKTVSQSSQVQ